MSFHLTFEVELEVKMGSYQMHRLLFVVTSRQEQKPFQSAKVVHTERHQVIEMY